MTSRFSNRPGQGSVEYIVVLALALSLALVILSVSGLFPSLSYDWQTGDSASYWSRAAAPLAIVDFKQTGTNLSVVLENRASTNLHLSSIEFAAAAQYTATSLPTLPPGGTTLVSLTTQTCSGRQVIEYNVSIHYSTDQVALLSERGAKPLYVQCTD